MLIFNSGKDEYKELHKNIIKYFHFLAKKSEQKLEKSDIKTWYTFNEVCNNWFGIHAEKTMLLYDGSGRDKISDMTVNLIKGYFCEYTQKFAKEYIPEKYCRNFPVDKSEFNYETESFITKEYYLPYIIEITF